MRKVAVVVVPMDRVRVECGNGVVRWGLQGGALGFRVPEVVVVSAETDGGHHWHGVIQGYRVRNAAVVQRPCTSKEGHGGGSTVEGSSGSV